MLIRSFRVRGLGHHLVAPQHGLYPGHQLLGIKGLDHIVVSPQLKPQHLVKDLALGGEHDNRDLGAGAQLAAHLIAVHAGKHQIKENQVRVEDRENVQRLLAVPHDLRFKAFLCQIQGNELRNVVVIVYD